MDFIIYFLIAITATTLGGLTGMGGGVIIKPVLDVIGRYDAATIGVLSSITVFAMSVVSVGKQVAKKAKIDYTIAITLAVGSIIGGLVGQKLLNVVITSFGKNSIVTMIQNVILALLIITVYIYMKNKRNIKSYHVKNLLITLTVGIFFGTISSFVGIGGGPINVALIIFVFSYDTKMAATCSIITILFAQISKLVSVALTTGFAIYDLSILPFMVIGAVLGGFIGSYLSGKFTEKKVEFYFNLVQLFVFLTCIFNIARNL